MDAATFLNLISDFKDKPKIVVFTAQPSEEIEHDILKSNVVDYIRKTENPEILSTRVKRILEGNHNIVSKLVSEQENLEVNIEYRNVIKDGEEIILTNTEFELLRLFLENKNRVLSREKIYSSLWASKKKYLDELRTIDVHVLNLRKKVKVECIQNRKGVGYVWDER